LGRMSHFLEYLLIGFAMKAGKILIKGLLFLTICSFLLPTNSFSGELSPGEKRRIESGTTNIFEIIISLLKRERFGDIYEYGDQISREAISKEMFISRMREINYQLAESWETVRDIEVEVVSPRRANLKATLGFPGPRAYGASGETIFQTMVFEMTFDKDEWRINLRPFYDRGSTRQRGWRGPRNAR